MKKTLLFIFIILCSYYHNLYGQTGSESEIEFENRELREKLEFERIKDPNLNRIPYERLSEARKRVQESIRQRNKLRTPFSNQKISWNERGPNNIGGITNSLMIDPNDASEKKVWAATGGGLWYNNNITTNDSIWHIVDDFWEDQLVKQIVYSPKNTNIYYALTGHTQGTNGGVNIIMKSVDKGKTWVKVREFSNTITGNMTYGPELTFNKIAVNSLGHLYAATTQGILKSIDEGKTWENVFYEKIIGNYTSSYEQYSSMIELDIATDDVIFAANWNRVYKSTDFGKTWQTIFSSGTIYAIQLALAPSTKGKNQVVYLVLDNQQAVLKKSVDGGITWKDTNKGYERVFNDQGLYNLTIEVHPKNPDIIGLGSNSVAVSNDGGDTWKSADAIMLFTGSLKDAFHVDQHALCFRSSSTQEIIMGNDGGVHYSSSSTATKISTVQRNNGFNITQLYDVAVKNTKDGDFFGATQDNGTLGILNNMSGINYYGGDGTVCFIDQNQPDISISILNNKVIYFDYKKCISVGNSTFKCNDIEQVSSFISNAEYDNENNTLYLTPSIGSGNDIIRISKIGTEKLLRSTINTGKITNYPMTLKLSKYSGALFFVGRVFNPATNKIYKIVNPLSDSPEILEYATLPQWTGYGVSGYFDRLEFGASDKEIIATIASYGSRSIWYTNDGGKNWVSKDENTHGLPDIPVYSVLFNPNNSKQVMIGTELGVWVASDITLSNFKWEVANDGLANIRCNKLVHRSVDDLVVVGTFGRGVYTTDAFKANNLKIDVSTPKNVICRDSLAINFNVSGKLSGNSIYKIYLSDSTGNFNKQTLLTSINTNLASIKLPNTVTFGTKYKIKVTTENQEVISISSAFTIAPAISANDFTPVPESLTFCEGTSIKIKTNEVLDYSYQWKKDNIVIQNANKAVYTLNQTGKYSVEVKNQGGCSFSSKEIEVRSVKVPSSEVIISGKTTFCIGDSVRLTAKELGLLSYEWIKDGKIIQRNSTMTAKESGNYMMNIAREGCRVTSAPIIITAYPLPFATVSLVGSNIINYGDSAKVNISFTSVAPWTVKLADNKEITTAENPYIYKIKILKDETVILSSVRNGCGIGNVSGKADLKVLILNKEEETDGAKVNIYPTPTQSGVYVKISSSNLSVIKILVTDLQGRNLIEKEDKLSSLEQQYYFDLKERTAGVYLFNVTIDGKSYISKVVKF